MSAYVIGIDPGGTTGICIYNLGARTGELLQATPGVAIEVIERLASGRVVVRLAVERFVVGPRSARSSTAKAGQTTRELIGALEDFSRRFGIRVVQRSASEVKPWATDKRLTAAGLLVKGMPHAVDGARHALFCAVSDCGLPDPLSRSTPSAPRRATP